MSEAIESYPLHWPPGWPRTRRPQRANFRIGRKDTWSQSGASLAASRDNLLAELERLGAKNVIISTNIPVRRDGLPYAKAREPEDSGVAVYFQLKGEEKCFPCDRWNRVADNLHAIGLSIGALRGLDRWGASHMVDAAFRGFKALPQGPQWWQVLGLERESADEEQIRAAYRQKARERHPDVGGSHEAMIEVKAAIETGLAPARMAGA